MKAELLDTNGVKIAPAPLSHTEAVADQLGERDRRHRIMEMAEQTIKARLIADIRALSATLHPANSHQLRGGGLSAGELADVVHIAIGFLGMVAEQVEAQERPDGTFAIGLPLPEEPAPKKTRRSSRK